MEDRHKRPNAIYFPFIHNFRKDKTIISEGRFMVAKAQEQEEKTDCKVAQRHFQGDGSVLFHDYGSGYITLSAKHYQTVL